MRCADCCFKAEYLGVAILMLVIVVNSLRGQLAVMSLQILQMTQHLKKQLMLV